MSGQVFQIQRELEYMLNATKFEMSSSSKEEFLALTDQDWL